MDNTRKNEPKEKGFSLPESLLMLAIPFKVVEKAVINISNNNLNSDLQIPIFPKSQFGKATMSLQLTPIFEITENISSIRTLKIESGRINRKSLSTIPKKFELLEDFKNMPQKNRKNSILSEYK